MVKDPRYLENSDLATGQFGHKNVKNENNWFLNAWRTSLVPICKDSSVSPAKDCADFRPSFSNNGLCFTRNGIPTDMMFKKTPYMDSFNNIMLYGATNTEVLRNRGSGIQHQYSFLVDANRYKDLRRGLTFEEEVETDVKLTVHAPNLIADTKGTGVQIYSGYKTTIRINVMQFFSTIDVKKIEISKRGCRFDDEIEDLNIFSNYSRINCLFECSMEWAETVCGCRPWDFPRKKDRIPSKNDIPICDYFGSSCFHTRIQTDQGQKECVDKCTSDCNEIKYTISIEQNPLDPSKVCLESFGVTKKKFEIENTIWNHIFGLEQQGSDILWKKKTAIDGLIRIVQDAFLNPNKSLSDIEYCKEKVAMDIGVVHIVVNSPTVLRLVQSIRVNSSDKLAIIGNTKSITI